MNHISITIIFAKFDGLMILFYTLQDLGGYVLFSQSSHLTRTGQSISAPNMELIWQKSILLKRLI